MLILIFSAISVIAYLLGSISPSIIFTKLFMKKDIREFGSGNAGLTNVLRTAGKLPAVLTLVGDVAKVAVAVLSVYLLTGSQDPIVSGLGAYLAGFFCLMGHLYPCYYGFKGGKGVLVSASMILFTDWRVCLIVLAIFAAATLLTRWVSLGSILASAAYPIATWFLYSPLELSSAAATDSLLNFVYTYQRFIVTAIALIFAVIVISKHNENIKRLLHGNERKISFHKKGSDE